MFPKPERPAKAKRSGSDYLFWIKSQPCARCGEPGPSDAAHVMGAVSPKTGMPLARRVGIAYRFAIPLCKECHQTGRDSIHAVGEAKFFDGFGRGQAWGVKLAASYLLAYLSRAESDTY